MDTWHRFSSLLIEIDIRDKAKDAMAVFTLVDLRKIKHTQLVDGIEYALLGQTTICAFREHFN